MIGGLLKSTSRLAIMAATGMFVGGLALTPAQAADLGGDCCADLEERVADLEATTARKGNRKVSLKVSGAVHKALMWLEDDRGNSEFGVVGSAVADSYVQFSGSAKLTSSWTIGFVYDLEFRENRNTSIEQAGQVAGASWDVDKEYIYLSNAQLGTIALGHLAAPTSGVSNISLAGRGVTGDSAGDSWNGVANASGFDLEADTVNGIGYISPTIAGFTASVAWADQDDSNAADPDYSNAEDAFAAALRYAGEFGPIRIAAGIGYLTDDGGDDVSAAVTAIDGANVMGSVALMHTPTGLNIAFAAGQELDGGWSTATTDTTDAEFWHVEGGISQNFFGPGKTSIYGEYGEYDTGGLTTAAAAGAAGDDAVAGDSFATNGADGTPNVDPTTTMWGVGIVQNFDSAATELYIAYRHWENDSNRDAAAGGAGGAGTAELPAGAAGAAVGGRDGDVSQIMAGARIKF